MNLQSMVTLIGQIVGGIGTLVTITLWVWIDQRGKTERRKLEHLERMKAIEHGLPLNDAEVARARALGAVGVAVPIAALSGGAIATGLLLIKPEIAMIPLIVLWPVVGVVSLVSTVLVVGPLRRPVGPREYGVPRPPAPVSAPSPRPVSGITELRSSE